MRVDRLLAAGRTRSFEFFPPKTDQESSVLAATLDDLERLRPSFVSVTYRAGAARARTFDLVTKIQRAGHFGAMAHVTCVGHRRAEMRDVLVQYRDAGVESLMALAGDPLEGPADGGELAYALDLVRLAREVGEFSIGVAAHPQGHPRSPDLASDRRHLAEKLREADFAITQFFFAASEWRALVDDLAALGVDRPVLPGVMPVTTLSAITRMAEMGATVPEQLAASLIDAHARGGPAAARAAGVAAATRLCEELLDAGAPGLHFYTLNRSTATREIHDALFGPDDFRPPGGVGESP